MKLLLVIVLYCAAAALSVGGMMFGWGLTPQNWWWILCAFFGTFVIATLIGIVGEAL